MNKKILLEDFKKALDRFAEAMEEVHQTDIEKAGCIQYFEFTFEISWKAIKSVAGGMGLNECLSPKAALKCAYSQGWINDENLWLDMLACRNRMSHTYETDSALEVYRKLVSFVPAFKDLHANICSIE